MVAKETVAALTICLATKNARRNNSEKEQAQMRRLDQFYLTSSNPGSGDAFSPSTSRTNVINEDHSDSVSESSMAVEGIVMSADEDVSETGAECIQDEAKDNKESKEQSEQAPLASDCHWQNFPNDLGAWPDILPDDMHKFWITRGSDDC